MEGYRKFFEPLWVPSFIAIFPQNYLHFYLQFASMEKEDLYELCLCDQIISSAITIHLKRSFCEIPRSALERMCGNIDTARSARGRNYVGACKGSDLDDRNCQTKAKAGWSVLVCGRQKYGEVVPRKSNLI